MSIEMHFTAKAQGRKSYAEEPTAQLINGEFHKEMSSRPALCLQDSMG
jgi:hypothetical protein